MADEITNKELAQACWDCYPNGPSIGFKLLLQEALKRLIATPDTFTDQTAAAPSGADTVAASETTQTIGGTEPSPQSQSTEPTPASNHADVIVAGEGGAATVIASDNPVQNMPASPRARAHLRMGRTADGKGRP